MIQALEQASLPAFTSEQLGELQTQMLIQGGQEVRDHRVEVIAYMSIRCCNSETDGVARPVVNTAQEFILDVLNTETNLALTSFRYQRTLDLPPRTGFELQTSPLGRRFADTTRTFLGNGDGPEAVLDMLSQAVAAAEGTSPWPRPKTSDEQEDKLVLGDSLGGRDVMLRARKLVPALGSIMMAAGHTLAGAGNGTAADCRININAGRHFYSRSSLYPQEISIWARSETESAKFTMAIKSFDLQSGQEQAAFTSAQLVLKEYGVQGGVRQTVDRIAQRGDEMHLVRNVELGDQHTEESEVIGLDGIVAMAARVQQVVS